MKIKNGIIKYFSLLPSYHTILSQIASLLSPTGEVPAAAFARAKRGPPALCGTGTLHGAPCHAAASPSPRGELAVTESVVAEVGYIRSWTFEGKTELDTSVPTGYHHRDYFL